MNENLHDKSGKYIGKIETKPDGGQVIHDATGLLLGHYDPSRKRTYDARGNLVGSGNQLVRLLNLP